MGVYLVPNGEWVLDDMAQAEAVGNYVPFAVILRLGWTSEATPTRMKQRSPHTKVCERWMWEPPGPDWRKADLYAEGVNMVNMYVSRFPIDRNADYHYILNEPLPGPGTASFWSGAMDCAAMHGIKLAIGNFPVTWPALPLDLDEHGQPKYFRQFWTLPDVWAMVDKAKRGGHILSWHNYVIPDPGGSWASGYGIGREDMIIANLPPQLRSVPIAITEYGTGCSQAYDDNRIMDGIRQGDAFFHRCSANIIGGAMWCHGPWTDNAHPNISSDLGFHRGVIREYWKTVRF